MDKYESRAYRRTCWEAFWRGFFFIPMPDPEVITRRFHYLTEKYRAKT